MSTPGTWPSPAAGKPDSNLDRSPPKILPASCNGLAPRSATLLHGDGFSATACRRTCRGAIQRAATLIFIADWSNCLRSKLLKLALPKVPGRRPRRGRDRFGALKRRRTAVTLRHLRPASRAAVENIPEKMVNANCGTPVGRAGVPERLPKSSCFLSLRSAVAACSSPYPEPALSSARSEGAVVELVACATGRTLVEFFATTVARPDARMLEVTMNSPATARPPGRRRLALIAAGALALLGSFVITAPAQAGYYEDSYYRPNPCSYRCGYGYPHYGYAPRYTRPTDTTMGAPRAARDQVLSTSVATSNANLSSGAMVGRLTITAVTTAIIRTGAAVTTATIRTEATGGPWPIRLWRCRAPLANAVWLRIPTVRRQI